MNQTLRKPWCQLVAVLTICLYTSIAYASTNVSSDSLFNVNRDTVNAHCLLNNDFTSAKLFHGKEAGGLLIEDNYHGGDGPLSGEPSKQPYRIAGGYGESIAARKNWRSNPKNFLIDLGRLVNISKMRWLNLAMIWVHKGISLVMCRSFNRSSSPFILW